MIQLVIEYQCFIQIQAKILYFVADENKKCHRRAVATVEINLFWILLVRGLYLESFGQA